MLEMIEMCGENSNKNKNNGQDHGDVKHVQGSADVIEIGGPKGLEPTRFGDWEQKGRCTDF